VWPKEYIFPIARIEHSLNRVNSFEDAVFEHRGIYFVIQTRPTSRLLNNIDMSSRIDYFELYITNPDFEIGNFASMTRIGERFNMGNSCGVCFNATNSEIMQYCDLMIVRQLHSL